LTNKRKFVFFFVVQTGKKPNERRCVCCVNLGATYVTHAHRDVLEKRAPERRWYPREGDTVVVKGLGGWKGREEEVRCGASATFHVT
jgi:hypothetical protein